MTRPAQAFKVAVFISTAVSLRLDVVHAGRLLHDSMPKVVLTQAFVTFQNAGTDALPLRTITTLVTSLARLILLPALSLMFITVAATIRSGVTTAPFSAGFRRFRWHRYSFMRALQYGCRAALSV